MNESYVFKRFLPAPVIPWKRLQGIYSPINTEILPAVGYFDMNDRRKRVFSMIKKSGYSIRCFIHPQAYVSSTAKIGEGLIALEHTSIQPFSRLGDGNILLSGAVISHNARIGNFNWFAPNSTIAGGVEIGNNCFFGCNSAVRNEIEIADYTLVGAGSYVRKNTKANMLIKPQKSIYITGKSIDQF